MFPLRKLGELSPRTRLRKAARILQGLEGELLRGGAADPEYLRGLLQALAGATEAAPPAAEAAEALGRALSTGAPADAVARAMNALRNGILSFLGAEPSEWDLLSPETGGLDRSSLRVLPITAYLEDLRSPFNVGSILRTAEAFGAARVYLSPRTPLPTHPRARKTARGAEEAIPWEVAPLPAAAAGPVLALELGGTELDSFPFPRSGMVLVGSEELGLSPEALALADGSLGRVSIPLAGAKRSLNVSVAFGILMARWFSALR
jgi:RNA methyltransferase, TrmH family